VFGALCVGVTVSVGVAVAALAVFNAGVSVFVNSAVVGILLVIV
jgi:hypothetical protein